MAAATLDQMRREYADLKARRDSGNLSPGEFVAQVGQLRGQDQHGSWWTVNAGDGRLLRFDGSAWVADLPPESPQSSASASSPTEAIRANLRRNLERLQGSRYRLLIPFAGIILSGSCGLLWMLYSFLRLGQGEDPDLITPVIMAGMPALLWIFREPIDRMLLPLEPFRRSFPRPLLVGVAFAVPVLLGLACSSFRSHGYGAMRMTAFLSILVAYVLLRRQEGTR